MDKKLLEELDIHEVDKDKIIVALKMELSEIDQKLGFLEEDNPKAIELQGLYSRIEKAIEDCKTENTKDPQKEPEVEYLPNERKMEESLPMEKGKEKPSIAGFINKIKEKLPVVEPGEADHEKELRKKAKEELAKKRAEQKKQEAQEKKLDKQDKQDESASQKSTSSNKQTNQYSQEFTEGMMAFHSGKLSEAIAKFNSVLDRYDKKKDNKEEAGEASYMLSLIYGDKQRGTHDAPRQEFYLEKAAKDLRHPDAMVAYGIVLATKLSSSSHTDDTALLYFERAAESSRASDKTKNVAKLKYVETCEKYRGFKNRRILKAAEYCKDLAKLEKEAFLKQNWVKREKKLKKGLRGIASIKANFANNIFGNIVSGVLFLAVLLVGNIGFKSYMTWAPGEDFEVLDRLPLPIPFLAESVRLYEAGPLVFSLSPFHEEVTIRSDEQTRVYMPFVRLSEYEIIANEAESVVVPNARFVEINAPKAKEIRFPEDVSEICLSNIQSMSEITIPDGVHKVVLDNCPSLATINLPSSVNEFSTTNCPRLVKVNNSNSDMISKMTLNSSGSLPKSLLVPGEMKSAIVDTYNEQFYAITLREGVQDVVLRMTSTDALNLPTTMKSLQLECTESIPNLTLPENTTEASIRTPYMESFEVNEKLEKLSIFEAAWSEYTVPETVASIEIEDWPNLTTLEIPASQTIAIRRCPNLTKLILPEGMSMEDITIYDCPLLEQ